MKRFENLTDYDLLTKIYVVNTEYGGRQSAIHDGYRGQFFWHINEINCSDWDAVYYFEQGSVNLGDESICKIVLSENLKKYSKGEFPANRQFCIREGSKVVAVGVVLESLVKNA